MVWFNSVKSFRKVVLLPGLTYDYFVQSPMLGKIHHCLNILGSVRKEGDFHTLTLNWYNFLGIYFNFRATAMFL